MLNTPTSPTDKSAQPRYRQLAASLRAAIADGTYGPGAQLPTEGELARRFDVSRGTVIKAITELVGEGVVTKRQGSGSYVSLPSLHRRWARLVSFSETVTEQGRKAGQRVLSYGPADEATARAFGSVAPSVQLVRLRYVDGVAYSVHRSIVPQRVIDRLPAESLGQLIKGGESRFSLYAAFEAAGLIIERGTEHISARIASKDEARMLNLKHPAALMVVIRQSYDRDGQLIEAVEAVYDAASYSYDLDLERGLQRAAPHRLRIVSGT